MKKIRVFIFGLIIASCDNRADKIFSNNTAPALTINGKSESRTDSIKLNSPIIDKDIPYTIAVSDKETKTGNVTIKITGNGAIINSSKEDVGKILNLPNILSASFSFKATTEGSSTINVSATDALGATSSQTIQIIIFKNKRPIAHLAITKSTANGLYGVVLDASASRDGDASHGGHIQNYKYITTDANSYRYEITSKKTRINTAMPSLGNFTVRLEVTDNDGDSGSTTANITF